ncbi:Inositol-1,4,5-trisphosphate 5-phosphatase 1 [Collariella sp. IMI 366227]|nr:Inositol-1,4,5-trisphosphate 5-phosphatase 1 [Collariella sp. IMI 366227]
MDYSSAAPSTALWPGQPPSPEKSSQILIREYPHRAIAIASHSHALILRHSNTTSEAIANGFLASVSSARQRPGNDNAASKCMVEFTQASDKLLADYRPLTPRPIYGTLGLISIGRDVFLCVITQASRVATLRPGETVEKIEAVQFFCLNSAEYDDVVALDPYELEQDAASVYGQGLGRRDVTVEHPCLELQKLLGNGTFYYSTDFDVTNRMQDRFNSRGIDDDGNVANFVETETTYWSPSGVIFSYAQVRGSVPVFWEQAAGLLPNQQKITITRSADGTQPAFDKHFSELEQAYGAVHVINLLSATKPGEYELTTLYRRGIQNCPLSRPGGKQSKDHALLRETEYDFHAETKGPQGYVAAHEIRRYIEDSADGFAYYLAHESNDSGRSNGSANGHKNRRYVVVLQQEGVFRTNCLDCLDRTNLIQTIISQLAVEAFLGHRGESAPSDFWSRHANLWADNGDSLSKIYAGTGALKSSFTRTGKMSLAGAIADVRKSATRLYYNNFADKARQITIDTLLGRLVGQPPVVLFDPISDYVAGELQRRSGEFSSNQKIHILVGTFNLNGRTDGISEDLSAWLWPSELGAIQPEIIAIGFQEIVELNPQQIMNSDPTRKQLWEQAIKRTLDHHYSREGDEKYVLLRSGQLVGAALCIFVKASVLHNIKNVEGSVKKTGMSGMAGNKGAVAIRMDYANTPICFVTAHLAAGFSNYEERNRDYATIDQGLWFQRNRGIADHDSVIWFGDFNYRIGLGLEAAKELVKRRDLERLFENDQLNLQMVAGLSFPFYSEARITFMPTYKYDVDTDDFDSSEKARIPAWTDRILRKGPNLRQLAYNSAPLRFSDHRPVYAIFECGVNLVNEKLRDKISREIYERRKAEVGGETANLAENESDDEDLIGYDAIEPGLPPASSDRQKWWLENGKMAKSSISPPKPDNPMSQTILNPKRPTNPHMPTEEPDWLPARKPTIPVQAPVLAPGATQKQTPPPPPAPRRTQTVVDLLGDDGAAAGRSLSSQQPHKNQDEISPLVLPGTDIATLPNWIRGWSQAVTVHGDEAYCACSETIHTTAASDTNSPTRIKARRSKTTDLTSNVRAILHRTTSATPHPSRLSVPSPELSLCRNCSRPASPAASTGGGSVTDEKHELQGGRGISKRFSELLSRVRPRQSRSAAAAAANKRDAEIRNLAWPEEYQPQWATTGKGEKRLLVRPPSQPLSAPAGVGQKGGSGSKAKSMDIFPGHAFRRKAAPNGHGHGGGIGAESTGSDLDELSDSDAPRHGLSRSMSRLQRAAALLHRVTSRPKD